MRTPFLPAAVALLALATAVGACSDSGGDVVGIKASDDSCVPERTDLAAGKTTFRVQNQGKQVTEVYVYAEGDRVVTERENIGPGTSADFTANLAAGTYEIACKPGQTGDGIRQTITVTGEGGEALPEGADRRVQFQAHDYDYTGLDDVSIDAGTAVEFDMENDGTVQHEFEVFGPDDEALGEIGPTDPGDEGTVVLQLDEPGTYRYVCGIDGHEALGMHGTFEVG